MPHFDKPPINQLIDELYHYGMPRRSGRYPYGSGKDPYQHSGDFLSRVEELRKQNFTFTDKDGKTYRGDTAIAKSMDLTTTQFRTQYKLANNERRSLQVDTAKGLKAKGYSATEIGRKMGINESSVRSLLKEDSEIRMKQAQATADIIRKSIEEKGMIDVGTGVERELGVSKEKLKEALYILELEGYPTYGGRVPQPTNPSQKTTIKVICPKGTEHKEIFNYENIHSMKEYASTDDGETFRKFEYPSSLDSKRLQVRYKEDGGIDKDGIIELRRGCQDLDLGGSRYSQVRILVDGKKYLKGMAVYSDDMPPGVDVIFNTNKSKDVPKMEVLKDIKSDPDNPFGSAIKPNGQYHYIDKDGKEKLGLINKRADEGDWSDWKDKLPSQFLAKQPLSLAKRQLGLAIDKKQAEYDSIMSLTNPTVKKRLLQSFSDDCDSAAVHLSAAALPRQKYHVIIPITSMKDNEIYAPKYKDGEKVALIRYPHGGTFEIPILTVNNKQATAKKLLGTDISDAVGINSKVAERLSGADFDGDTVMVIPTNDKVKIKSTPPLKDLEGFDPKMTYGTKKVKNPKYTGAKGEEEYFYYNSKGKKITPMSKHNTQIQMGIASNLITDMTLRGAEPEELARAVKHSMVVIDAEKHKLDYKSSYVENGIESLKKKYQGYYDKDGKYRGGASTLLSRAKSPENIPKTQGSPKINMKGKEWYDPSKPEGAYIYKKADDLYRLDRTYNKSTGETVLRTTSGKTITYNYNDKKEREKYEPLSVKDPKTGKSKLVTKTDPDTGEVIFTNKSGTIKYMSIMRTQESTKMKETNDARSLISTADTPMEREYANYANKMKSLANKARKEMMNTKDIKYDASASKLYSQEVKSLNQKLMVAEKNAPKERQAIMMATSVVNAKKKSNPGMTKEELKKLNQRELTRARNTVGAKRENIEITEKEWNAIQAGAISPSKLSKILNNTNIDTVKQLATPLPKSTLPSAKVSKINSMRARGYTLSQIADAVGVSPSTVSEYLS